MVIITYKVKKTMDDDPVQLLVEISSVFYRIFPDAIDADEKVT